MGQQLLKLAGALGGAAVVFYAIGFTVVQTYVHRHHLGSVFFFTDEFYRDAGAVFLLDMARAPILGFVVFMPYLLLLFWLMPGAASLKKPLWPARGGFVLTRSESFGLLVLGLMAATVLLLQSELFDSSHARDLMQRVFLNPAGYQNVQRDQKALAFFALVTPLLVVGAHFMYLCATAGLSKLAVRRRFEFFLLGYILFLAAVPVSYGVLLYDWPIERVTNGSQTGAKRDATDAGERYFVGEFRGRYVFLRKQASSSSGWAVESQLVNDVKQLSLDFRATDESLKLKIEEIVRPTDAIDIRNKSLDALTDVLRREGGQK